MMDKKTEIALIRSALEGFHEKNKDLDGYSWIICQVAHKYLRVLKAYERERAQEETVSCACSDDMNKKQEKNDV